MEPLWRSHEDTNSYPPTMLSAQELRLLNWLTSSYYQGVGAIVDGGCFLGGSTIALASGLPSGVVHSYDVFSTHPPFWNSFLENYGLQPNQNFEARYRENIAAVADKVQVHAGNLLEQAWCGEPIEILFLDVCKTPELQDYVSQVWFPRLIPGRSIVVQQDYGWRHCPWIMVMMEVYKEHFRILDDVLTSSRVYLCTKAIEEFRSYQDVSPELRLELMQDAVASAPKFKLNLLYNIALLAKQAGQLDVARAALEALVREPDRYKTIEKAKEAFGDLCPVPPPVPVKPKRFPPKPQPKPTFLKKVEREVKRLWRQMAALL